jgi:hypothetical protein
MFEIDSILECPPIGSPLYSPSSAQVISVISLILSLSVNSHRKPVPFLYNDSILVCVLFGEMSWCRERHNQSSSLKKGARYLNTRLRRLQSDEMMKSYLYMRSSIPVTLISLIYVTWTFKIVGWWFELSRTMAVVRICVICDRYSYFGML